MGFPTRDARNAFGPTMENVRSVVNPKQDADAAIINKVWWDVAGMNRVSPMVEMRATVAGGVVSNTRAAVATAILETSVHSTSSVLAFKPKA